MMNENDSLCSATGKAHRFPMTDAHSALIGGKHGGRREQRSCNDCMAVRIMFRDNDGLETVVIAAPLPVKPKTVSTTIFECRTCASMIGCRNDDDDVEFQSAGWKRIRRIDGPNAICPLCQADPSALDALKADGYENAYVI